MKDNTGLCPNSHEVKLKDDVLQFPHLAVFTCSSHAKNMISNAPIIFTWREKSFVLRGAILGSTNHFTASMRDKHFWVFYDGIGGTNGYGRMLTCAPEDVQEMVGRYFVTAIIYEIVDKCRADQEYEVWLGKEESHPDTSQKSHDDIQNDLKELASNKKSHQNQE